MLPLDLSGGDFYYNIIVYHIIYGMINIPTQIQSQPVRYIVRYKFLNDQVVKAVS